MRLLTDGEGRISWPIPFNQSTQDPTQNAFFEYSALGVFGNGFVKGGMRRFRNADGRSPRR